MLNVDATSMMSFNHTWEETGRFFSAYWVQIGIQEVLTLLLLLEGGKELK